MECCECSQPGGDDCSMEKCERKCRGNYCLIDFDGVEQVSNKYSFSFLLNKRVSDRAKSNLTGPFLKK